MQAQARVASFPDMEDGQQFARSRVGAPTFQQLLAGVPIEPLQFVRTLLVVQQRLPSQTPERRNPTELAIGTSPSVF